jgi:hypothetical protein
MEVIMKKFTVLTTVSNNQSYNNGLYYIWGTMMFFIHKCSKFSIKANT